jgi:ubiquinone/menaquinone biosynthesis C-methylase UbiE
MDSTLAQPSTNMLSRRLTAVSDRLSSAYRKRSVSDVSAVSGKTAKANANQPTTTPIPSYLRETYWWAYLHPKGVHLFERPWIVNAILWGNYDLLVSETICEIDPSKSALQVACAYGSVTPRLAQHMQAPLDVVDVAPIQLENLERKLKDIDNPSQKVQLSISDASKLSAFADGSREHVIFFFLLHELPQQVRREALSEAWRVLSVGGKLVIIDYHRPNLWAFHRYFMPFIFHTLEPFALDLWQAEIISWLPEASESQLTKKLYYRGLYQKVVITKNI